jgi:hypothetical protein
VSYTARVSGKIVETTAVRLVKRMRSFIATIVRNVNFNRVGGYRVNRSIGMDINTKDFWQNLYIPSTSDAGLMNSQQNETIDTRVRIGDAQFY